MLSHVPVSAVISNGQSLSAAVNLQSARPFAIIMPAIWTAANLTFQASGDSGTTFKDVYDETGTELTVTAAASRFIVLSPLLYLGFRTIKIRSGTLGTPVNQGQDSTIVILAQAD